MDRNQKVVNVLVFGGFGLASVSRLLAPPLSPQTMGRAVALLLIALLGYRGAKSDRLARVWGILAFVVGWFWMPAVPLVALWVWSVLQRKHNRVVVRSGPAESTQAVSDPAVSQGGELEAVIEEPEEATPVRSTELTPEQRTLLRTTLALRLAAEWGTRVKRLHEPFHSPYGEGAIPVVVRDDSGERGFYVEVAPWTWPAQEECLRWLGLLRTSSREDLAVEICSDIEVPEQVGFYTGRSLRTSFELEGLLCMRWRTFGFAHQNASSLRRLAKDHLGVRFTEGPEGLRTLDELVLEYLRPDRHILPSTVLLLGSFLGEALIKRYGGQWLSRGEDVEQIVVGLPKVDGILDVNVFGKVMKLFRNGSEDSTAAMAVGLEAILGS